MPTGDAGALASFVALLSSFMVKRCWKRFKKGYDDLFVVFDGRFAIRKSAEHYYSMILFSRREAGKRD